MLKGSGGEVFVRGWCSAGSDGNKTDYYLSTGCVCVCMCVCIPHTRDPMGTPVIPEDWRLFLSLSDAYMKCSGGSRCE